ncbi:MAG: hypothetical protein ACM3SR_03975 [Ignavibacteriales bacterium]
MSPSLKRVAQNLGCLVSGSSFIALGILGVAIHVWTIIIAYGVSGLGSAILALIFPVLAELYWFFRVCVMTGTALNLYCISLLVYLGLWISLVAHLLGVFKD